MISLLELFISMHLAVRLYCIFNIFKQWLDYEFINVP